MYLLRVKRRPLLHIFDGQDTLCELRATDSIDLDNYQVTKEKPTGVPLCMRCRKRDKKRGGATPQVLPATNQAEIVRREADALRDLLRARKAEQVAFERYAAAREALNSVGPTALEPE